MKAFVLETLYPTGWRRDGELFWRLADAIAAGDAAVADGVHGYRILAATVRLDAIAERMAEREQEVADA